MRVVILSGVSNTNGDLAFAALATLAILYLVYLKVKSWSNTHPDDWAALLDKVGLHTLARSIWDKLAAKHAEEEANTFLGISLK